MTFSGWIEKIRGPKRNKAEEKRQVHEDQYGPPDFGDFIRASGCVVARQTGSREGCLGPIQHCHNKSRATGGGWHNNSFGACVGHHTEEHTKGKRTFERTYGLDLDLECLALTHQWERKTYGW